MIFTPGQFHTPAAAADSSSFSLSLFRHFDIDVDVVPPSVSWLTLVEITALSNPILTPLARWQQMQSGLYLGHSQWRIKRVVTAPGSLSPLNSQIHFTYNILVHTKRPKLLYRTRFLVW